MTAISPDHPRGCGENMQILSAQLVKLGSPPRMRGKPKVSKICFDEFRITPADAGKTAYVPIAYYNGKDHPRGCGENCPLI